MPRNFLDYELQAMDVAAGVPNRRQRAGKSGPLASKQPRRGCRGCAINENTTKHCKTRIELAYY